MKVPSTILLYPSPVTPRRGGKIKARHKSGEKAVTGLGICAWEFRQGVEITLRKGVVNYRSPLNIDQRGLASGRRISTSVVYVVAPVSRRTVPPLLLRFPSTPLARHIPNQASSPLALQSINLRSSCIERYDKRTRTGRTESSKTVGLSKHCCFWT